MTALLQSLQFGTPLALLGLLALPVIWWLLRFTPPRPRQIKFPPIRILLGLPNQQETPDKTPWWLLLLRLVLAAFFIFAVAQPFLQPKGAGLLPPGHRLVIVDNGWAAAGQWTKRRDYLIGVLEQARDAGAPVSLATTAAGTTQLIISETSARDALDKARLMKPVAQKTDRLKLLDELRKANLNAVSAIVWLADGLDAGTGDAFANGLQALAPRATLSIHAPDTAELPLALGPLEVSGNEIKVKVFKSPAAPAPAASVVVQASNGRTMLDVPVALTSGSGIASITLPTQLRNEIQTIAIADQGHAGARQLFDDRWRRRSISLVAKMNAEESQPLLSPLHYLRRGLEPFAELSEPTTPEEMAALMDAGLSMLVLSDVGALPDAEAQRIGDWVDKGGILLRFAGPRLAAGGDSLLPVTLREGGRSLGSALSWETPQGLQPFPEASPFAGLAVDPGVKVSRQVLAEPDAEIASRTWASLDDGTPLVTAEKRGKGLIVLFHVTSNANWSNLPLSGLFLSMLQRIAGLDPGAPAATSQSAADTQYVPRMMLTGAGDLVSADGSALPISQAEFASAEPAGSHPPGLYGWRGREYALNFKLTDADVSALAAAPGSVAVSGYQAEPRRDLAPLLFALAGILFLLDTLATLIIGGGLWRKPAIAILAACLLLPMARLPDAQAQDAAPSDKEMAAALQPKLAYVITGDSEIDRVSKEGLEGLTMYLTDRTSTVLAEPDAVDVEKEDLTLYPMLYWPVPDTAQPLSDAARQKLGTYLRNGGMVFFDTREGGLDLDGGGNDGLKAILAGLDLPPLEPVPDQHVLTRSFYLMDHFPGRYDGPRPWVEARAGEESADPGSADGVTSVVIGSNDYAAAWAIDQNGEPLYAVVPGTDRQREFAVRAGINVVMVALTGNYKADQVHVPAFLERLGQ